MIRDDRSYPEGVRHRILLLTVSLMTLLPADALARAGGGTRGYSRSPGFGGGGGTRSYGRGYGGGHFIFFGGGGGGGGFLLILLIMFVVLFLLSRGSRGRRP